MSWLFGLSGPTDLTASGIPLTRQGIIKTFLSGSAEEKHDAAVEASPIT